MKVIVLSIAVIVTALAPLTLGTIACYQWFYGDFEEAMRTSFLCFYASMLSQSIGALIEDRS